MVGFGKPKPGSEYGFLGLELRCGIGWTFKNWMEIMIILESSFEYPSPTLSSRFKLGRTPTISKVESAGGGVAGANIKDIF